MAPPLRTAADNAALWSGLIDDSLSFIVTDHCPFFTQQKSGRRRTPAWRRLPTGRTPMPPEEPWSNDFPPFYTIPGGAPGIELRLPLAYHFGVNSGQLSLSQFVNVTSTAAAKRFGLYPRKGTITPGADADIVILDPQREVIIHNREMHENCDYTPYEGMPLLGYPQTVISRGDIIIEDGLFKAEPGRGQYLARNKCWQ